jgi:O-antigen ligase
MVKKEKITLLLSWILLLISVNSYTNNYIISSFFLYKSFNYKNIYEIIENVIFTLPFFVFFYLLWKFIFVKKKIDKFALFFFIYGFWQLIIGIILHRETLEITNYQIIFSLLSVLLILYLSYIKKYNELFIQYLLVFIIFISFIGFYFSFEILREFITDSNLYYLYTTKVLSPETLTFGQPTPRITGISRILVIIFYFIFFYSVLKRSQSNYQMFLHFILFFLVTLIFLMQSRMAYIGLLVGLLFYIFFVKKNFIKKFALVIFIFVLPVITSKVIVYSKYYYVQKRHNITNGHLLNDRISQNKLDSSGRIDLWLTSAKIIKDNNLIFGNGPQSDRKLIAKYYNDNSYPPELTIYGTNSSNAIIYSILCGGIIGFCLLLAIYYLLLKTLCNFFLTVKKSHQNFLEYFLIATLIFLIARSVFENSFAVFGIDFFLISLCYYILILKKEKRIILQ